uniref:AlNc14C368G11072 protein n=1 Tax=Albugo laibachii Nc14 TaxID=890382 RepID=F0WY26_9STRA|nr:AlNc14C368G11072 [Albugo laibachii Nc14]|eukprot:CCA26375.1 AlNc14C368G11072 [Albugo laibachii Nc14]
MFCWALCEVGRCVRGFEALGGHGHAPFRKEEIGSQLLWSSDDISAVREDDDREEDIASTRKGLQEQPQPYDVTRPSAKNTSFQALKILCWKATSQLELMRRATKVHPVEAASTGRATHCGYVRRRSFWRKCVLTPTHVGLQGKYSYQKLIAFLRYQDSWHAHWRALRILSLSPFPTILVYMMVNGLPLADSAKGWRKACNYYITSWICAFIVFVCNYFELTHVVQDLKLKVWQRLAVPCVQASVLVLQKLFVAMILNIFPVPFSLIWPVFLSQFVGYLMVSYWVVGDSGRDTSSLHQRLKQYSLLYTAEEFVLVVYPAIATLFIYLPSSQKFWISVILPITKAILLQATHYLCHRLTPDVSGIVATTLVQFFHALFFMMCLQTSRSNIALAISIAFKLFSMAHFCTTLKGSSFALQKQLEDLINLERYQEALSSSSVDKSFSSRLGEAGNIVDATLLIMKFDEILRQQYSVDGQGLVPVESMETRGPSDGLILVKNISAGTRAERNAFADQVMALLYRNEHLLLCCYIDFIVPLLYRTATWEPNANYYTFIILRDWSQSLKAFRNVISSFVFAGISLAVHVVAVRRWINVSALQQIAFILTNYQALIQSQWIRLIIVLMFLSLQHSGNDFTFHFDWLKQSAANT